MMFNDILSAISLGRKLVETISALRRDVRVPDPQSVHTETKSSHVEALDSRLSDLESQTREYHARVIAAEQSVNDLLRATEALANRVSTIFWVACVASGVGLAGLILAIVALTRTIR
jgi:hypothetical protein